MKQRLYLFLMLVVATLTASARDFKYEGITYTVLDEEAKTVETKQGRYLVSFPNSGNHVSGSLVLPANPKDGEVEYTLVGIGSRGFYKTDLTNIVLPQSLTSIGSEAFYECTGLTKLELPESVTLIGSEAFKDCSGMEEIIYNAKNCEIDYDIFSGVNASKLVLGENVEVINKCWFITENFRYEGSPFLQLSKLKTVEYNAVGEPTLNYYEERKEMFPPSITQVFFGSNVTVIPKGVFVNCKELNSISFPESLTSIGEYAFSDCTGLTTIQFPASIQSIAYNAFSNCTGIASIQFPDSLKSIGSAAFSNCTGLTEIQLPNSLDYLNGFSNCSNLSSISIPNSVKNIGNSAFSGCSALISIQFPDSLQSIDSGAFRKCTGLTSIHIPEFLTSIGYGAFEDCSGIEEIIYDAQRCRIGIEAWKGVNATKLILGEKVQSINSQFYADHNGNRFTVSPFLQLSKLEDVIYNVTSELKCNFEGNLFPPNIKNVFFSDEITTIPKDLFTDCTGLTMVQLPDSLLSIESSAFKGCTSLKTIQLPESLTSIGSSAFQGCTSLKMIQFPESLTSIGSSAFSGCASLDTITIPEYVTFIGCVAFDNCNNLTTFIYNARDCILEPVTFGWDEPNIKNLIIGENVERVRNDNMGGNWEDEKWNGYYSPIFSTLTKLEHLELNSVKFIGYSSQNSFFLMPPSLTSVKFGPSIDYIPANIFNGCSKLTSLELPEGLRSIGLNAFSNCTGLTSISFPDSLIGISSCAFSNCTGLTSISFPDSLTGIAPYAFSNCTGLNSISFPDSLTEIDDDAFSNCTGLIELNLPDSLIYLSGFSKCTNLTSINLPNSIKAIGDSAFAECTGLTDIALPNSVKKIGNQAFYNCNSIKDIIIPDSLTSIGNQAFYHCIGLNSINLPKSLLDMGYAAFEGCVNLEEIVYNAAACHHLSNTYNGHDMWEQCGVKTITIGNEVEELDSYILSGLNNVETVFFNAEDCIFNSRTYDGLFGTNVSNIIFGQDVKSIPSCICRNCQKITSLVLPKGLSSIGTSAFYGCTGLTELKLPTELKTIDEIAFLGCDGIESLYFNIEDCHISKNSLPTSITRLTIGENVTNLKENLMEAFSNLSSLESIDYRAIKGDNSESNTKAISNFAFPASVKYLNIGDKVSMLPSELFFGMKGLENISFEARDFSLNIGKNVFSNCPNISEVNLPKMEDWLRLNFEAISSNPISNGAKLVINGENTRRVIIPEGTTRLGSYAFYGLEEALTVTLPTSLKEAGIGVFSDCSNLQQIIFPDFKTYLEMSYDKSDVNLTYENNAELYIGSENLSAYTDKTEIILPDDLTRIAPYAFYKNSYMESIDIPQTVISIGDYAFGSCHKLKSIELPNSVTELGEGVFQNSAIDYINVPSELETIGKDAFYYVSLKSFDIPDIEKWCGIAFANAYANPISAIGSFSVNGKEISNIRIGNEQTNIEPYSFCRANNIIRLRVDAHKIGEQAFSNCSNVSALCLHTDSIASKAFANMDSLKEIYCLTDTPPEAADDLFSKYNGITLHVPIGAKTAYENSQPCWWKFLNIVESDFKDIDMLFPSDIDSIETGVDEISSTGNEEREIFTLNGLRITGDKENLAPGVYIIIDHNRRHKIRIK